MVRIESNDGMTQVFIEGNGVKVMAESLTAVSSLWKSLDDQGIGNLFKALLTKDVISGELFTELDRKEDVTNLTHEEMLDVWGDLEKERNALRGVVDK